MIVVLGRIKLLVNADRNTASRGLYMEQRFYSFLVMSLSYFVIFLLSTLIPIFIYRKTKWWHIGVSLISLFLTICLINLYFYVGYYFRWPTHPAFHEFHEVFWIIPPIIVYLYCRYRDKKDMKGQDS